MYHVSEIPNEKEFLMYALQKSTYVSFCTFKSYHKKNLSSPYFDFLKRIEKFRYEPIQKEYERYQHYRSGQKFHYYELTDELKKIILEYGSIKIWKFPTLPEDIAFYIGKTPWFFSISHEDIYYLNTNDCKTINDLIEMNIKLSATM